MKIILSDMCSSLKNNVCVERSIYYSELFIIHELVFLFPWFTKRAMHQTLSPSSLLMMQILIDLLIHIGNTLKVMSAV